MKSYKEDFPLLRNSSIAYLDNAATAQRPEAVLKAEREFYEKYNANPLRGLYQLGMDATDCYEKARETVRDFLHAKKSSEIIFTRNTTESINLVAYSYALNNLKEGDELLVGIDSHHSNLLPWQMAARVTGAKLVFLDCEMDGSYTKEAIEKVITERTKFAAITHVSNVIGRVNPVEDIIRLVHKNGGVVLVDAAQSAPHLPIDVCAMDVDFLAFSGHKLMAPMGIGVLYGKEKLLDEMPPFLTGGEMIDSVTEQDAVWAPVPEKFEAGTQDAAGIYATGVALDYLVNQVGYEAIQAREAALVHYAMAQMSQLPYVDIIGSIYWDRHHGVISFNVRGIHPHDVASIMDMQGVCIRAGHHCAQPLLTWLGVENLACCRMSLAFYNDKHDVDAFLEALDAVWRTFNG